MEGGVNMKSWDVSAVMGCWWGGERGRDGRWWGV